MKTEIGIVNHRILYVKERGERQENMNNHIIFFSGGKSSFSVADYVKTHFPDDNIVLYFTDTLWEDEDLYRFIEEACDRLELPMLTHSMGINPMQLMFEQKLVFNSRIGECSKKLKMKVAADFLKKGKIPQIEKWRNKQFLKNEDFTTDATLYFGIGFEEMHRQEPIIKNWKPFKVVMPLIDEIIDNSEILKKYGLKQPRLYDHGFAHNNCKARCVKAGQGHYRQLKKEMPEVYKEILEQEYHMMMYVSSYRFVKDTPLDEVWGFTEDVKQEEMNRISEAYRDYFYGKAKKPKSIPHPAMAAPLEHAHIQKYSFMKKQIDGKVQPMTIRDFDRMLQSEPKQIDIFDIGGCGCFVEYDN